MAVCGIDSGTAKTIWYVAWLEDHVVTLDAFLPAPEAPLPMPPQGLVVSHYAVDAPQGLPALGKAAPRAARRDCDDQQVGAGTPTQKLPLTRMELTSWKLYRGLIEAGVDFFWSLFASGVHISGLPAATGAPEVSETYPRYVFRRAFPDVRLPSKTKRPFDYVTCVWGALSSRGYHVPGVRMLSPDQCDAVLAAVAAQHRASGTDAGTTGLRPEPDEAERVLREGLIVAP